MPGIEPGPQRSQRRIIATRTHRLSEVCNCFATMHIGWRIFLPRDLKRNENINFPLSDITSETNYLWNPTLPFAIEFNNNASKIRPHL